MLPRQTSEDFASNPTAGSGRALHPHGSKARAPARPSGLALMSGLGAIDGTIVILSAQGALSTWAGAIAVGLTVIGGAGVWIAARQLFGGRHRTMHDYALLAAIAAATSLATIAAAGLGAWLGNSIHLHIMPRAVGLVLLLVAADVGGIRLPKLGPAPLPVAATLIAVTWEGTVQWTK